LSTGIFERLSVRKAQQILEKFEDTNKESERVWEIKDGRVDKRWNP
jgi:hypothetical protein